MSRIFYTLLERDQMPRGSGWLTDAERERLAGFRFEKRRNDWLLGRWTAKHLLASLDRIEPDRIEIASDESGAPLPIIDGERQPATLSLSHSRDRSIATLTRGVFEHGCDIEVIEARSPDFIETFFTDAEQAAVAAAAPPFRDALVTITWSAKESTLKALRRGLRDDTRNVDVGGINEAGDDGWQTATVNTTADGHFVCFWRIDDGFVLTVAAREPAEAPTLIR